MSMQQRETREQRAARKFHALKFQLATIPLRDREGRTRRLPVVYVASDSGNTYTVTCPGGEPTHCDCLDCRRPWEDDPLAHGSTRCYHQIAAGWWLQGENPELPKPAFDIEAEAATLAALEAQEARSAQVVKDRELWD